MDDTLLSILYAVDFTQIIDYEKKSKSHYYFWYITASVQS